MKILHIMNYYQEEMGYQENWLPFFQEKLNNDVLIVASDKFFPFPDYDKSIKYLLGPRNVGSGYFYDRNIRIIRKKSFFELSNRASIVFNVAKEIRAFNPDIIHVHGVTNINIFQIFAITSRQKVKIFIDSHLDYQVSNYKSIANKIYYKFWSVFYKIYGDKVRAFLPITLESQNFLVDKFKIDRDRTEINNLGVNTDIFYFDYNERKGLLNELNITNKTILINAGKQYEKKEIIFIIKLLKKIVNSFNKHDVVLLLLGSASGKYDRDIESEIIDVKDNVIRIPLVPNKMLRSYYSAADIGIWPGIPSNTIQEAMACEVAVILRDNDTTSHLVENNGLSISVLNPYSVAKDIVNMMDENIIEECKKQSRKLALKYSWDQISRDSLSIYSQR